MTSTKAIIIKDLCKEYYKKDSSQKSFWSKLKGNKGGQPFYALKDINLEINRGEVIGIIGPNGAGKSTLLKILAEVTPPTAGSVEIFGKVASILQVGIGFQQELTGYENIFLSGNIYGLKRNIIESKFDSIVDMFGFPDFLHTPVKYYSSGMYMRLAFAVIANIDADIYLLDEVLSVGDLNFRDKVLNMISKMSGKGKTILIVTHAPDTIYAYCDKIAILNKAQILKFGKPQNCIAKYNLLAYENAEKQNLTINRNIENNKTIIDNNLSKHFQTHSAEVINTDTYFQGNELELEVKFTKSSNIKFRISYIIKDELNKPIAEIKSNITIKDSGNYKYKAFVPTRLLNNFNYLVDIFVYAETKLCVIYPKALSFKLTNKNKDSSFCMLEFNDFKCELLKESNN